MSFWCGPFSSSLFQSLLWQNPFFFSWCYSMSVSFLFFYTPSPFSVYVQCMHWLLYFEAQHTQLSFSLSLSLSLSFLPLKPHPSALLRSGQPHYMPLWVWIQKHKNIQSDYPPATIGPVWVLKLIKAAFIPWHHLGQVTFVPACWPTIWYNICVLYLIILLLSVFLVFFFWFLANLWSSSSLQHLLTIYSVTDNSFNPAFE